MEAPLEEVMLQNDNAHETGKNVKELAPKNWEGLLVKRLEEDFAIASLLPAAHK